MLIHRIVTTKITLTFSNTLNDFHLFNLCSIPTRLFDTSSILSRNISWLQELNLFKSKSRAYSAQASWHPNREDIFFFQSPTEKVSDIIKNRKIYKKPTLSSHKKYSASNLLTILYLFVQPIFEHLKAYLSLRDNFVAFLCELVFYPSPVTAAYFTISILEVFLKYF